MGADHVEVRATHAAGPAEVTGAGAQHGTQFPRFTPHDAAASHVREAAVQVDAGSNGSPLRALWASLGYDEINWTYTPRGRRLLSTVGGFSPTAFSVRPHNMFVSGTGFGLPHWGSGNVYHEQADGTPVYDFAIIDQVYDAITEAGHHVLVELGFTPRDLVPERAVEQFSIIDSPSQYSAYEAGRWSYPPRDYGKWADLVAALVRHSRERYGEDEVDGWLWELWNEPDIYYWRGTPEEFFELYAVTVRAVRSVLPTAKVGGPAVTGGPAGVGFLRGFLASVQRAGLPLDFVSFHTKGSSFTPGRTYGPIGAPAPVRQSPSTVKMLGEIRTLLRVMAEFPEFASLPAVVDECDAGVPAHSGVYDNANFQFQNTEYYPVFQVNLMKKILDLNATEAAEVHQATTWSFYFEGERYFEGTRALVTAGGIEKPLLNAYRALARLGTERITASSDAAWAVTALDRSAAGGIPEEVDVLASRGPRGTVTVLVYRHVDDQYHVDRATARVSVDVTGLVSACYRLEHLRIDADHSNAHTVWRSLGSPQDPTDVELAAITARQGLEAYEPDREVHPVDGELHLVVHLPLPSVSILVLTPHEPTR
jgi:xylan 1,4-beta-xylosidase